MAMPATSESGKLLEIFLLFFEPDDHITHDFYSNLRQIAEHYIQADIIRYNGIYRHENGTSRILYHWEQDFTGRILDKFSLEKILALSPFCF